MKRIFAVLCVFLGLVSGFTCANAESQAPSSHDDPLLMGLIPEQNIFKQVERYEPLTDYLSKKIGRKITLKLLTRYGNIVDNFVSERLDMAFFGSFSYALAYSKLSVEVLARPEWIDGTSTYYGLIFVRKDSGIRTAGDMEGKKFAFVDKATTAGYLLPLAYFKKHGIHDYKTYFKEAYFTGTHEDAIYDVINGRADIGAAKNTVFFRLAETDSRLSDELIILDRSPDVPANGLAVRKDLDESLKQKLRETLLNINEDAEGQKILANYGATRFIKTTLADYNPIFDYCKEINLDLSTYDYINE